MIRAAYDCRTDAVFWKALFNLYKTLSFQLHFDKKGSIEVFFNVKYFEIRSPSETISVFPETISAFLKTTDSAVPPDLGYIKKKSLCIFILKL